MAQRIMRCSGGDWQMGRAPWMLLAAFAFTFGCGQPQATVAVVTVGNGDASATLDSTPADGTDLADSATPETAAADVPSPTDVQDSAVATDAADLTDDAVLLDVADVSPADADSALADGEAAETKAEDGDVLSSTFVTCGTSGQCPGTQICNKSLGVCVDCVSDSDCLGQGSCAGTVCAKAGTIACASAKQCGPAGLVCDTSHGVCTDCLSDVDCAPATFCAYLPSSGISACAPDTCVPGLGKCVNGAPLNCGDNGNWTTASVCSGATVCGLDGGVAKCVATLCEPNAWTCGGDVSKQCSPDGQSYATQVDCAGKGLKCIGGTCVNVPCGNGKPDASEPCDDGNLQSGDGCSSTCQFECASLDIASSGAKDGLAVSVPAVGGQDLANSDYTIEAWVWNNNAAGDQPIVARHTDKPGAGFEFVIDGNNQLKFRAGIGGDPRVTGTVVPAQQWTHLAVTYNLATKATALFIQGASVPFVLEGTDATLPPLGAVSAPLTIGSQFESGAYYFGGKIAAVRLSKSVQYTSDFNPQPLLTANTSTVALWTFAAGSGSTVKGFGTAAADATLVAATWSSGSPGCPYGTPLLSSPGTCKSDGDCVPASGAWKLACDTATGLCHDVGGKCDGLTAYCNVTAGSSCTQVATSGPAQCACKLPIVYASNGNAVCPLLAPNCNCAVNPTGPECAPLGVPGGIVCCSASPVCQNALATECFGTGAVCGCASNGTATVGVCASGP